MNLRLVFWCLILISDALSKKSRIFGGSPAVITDYPHLASIRNMRYNSLICAGSIITKWNILTAAHCLFFFRMSYENIGVFTGSTYSTNGNVHQIQHVIFHEEFAQNIHSTGIVPHDIAIIFLRTNIQINTYQQPIALPSRRPSADNLAIIAGWGVSGTPYGYFTSRYLRKAPAIVLQREECISRTPFPIADTQFCTFYSYGMGICTGDGGGSVSSNGELYGIITYTFWCAHGLPDVHTTVYDYLDFIRAHITE